MNFEVPIPSTNINPCHCLLLSKAKSQSPVPKCQYLSKSRNFEIPLEGFSSTNQHLPLPRPLAHCGERSESNLPNYCANIWTNLETLWTLKYQSKVPTVTLATAFCWARQNLRAQYPNANIWTNLETFWTSKYQWRDPQWDFLKYHPTLTPATAFGWAWQKFQNRDQSAPRPLDNSLLISNRITNDEENAMLSKVLAFHHELQGLMKH